MRISDGSMFRIVGYHQIELAIKEHNEWLTSSGKKGNRFVVQDLLDDWSGDAVNLGERDLQNANFEKADLRGATFSEGDLTGVSFYGADLTDVDLSGADLTNTNMRHARLVGADLSETKGLTVAQLGGANLSGAQLPTCLGELSVPESINDSIKNAAKHLLYLLSVCVYAWLATMSKRDVVFFTDTPSYKLPIIGTQVPAASFYVLIPIVLLCLYIHVHLYMQRLWEDMAALPAVFVDGTVLHKVVYPWIPTSLVRGYYPQLKIYKEPTLYLQILISALLVWAIVPITLECIWVACVSAHQWRMSVIQLLITIASIGATFYFCELTKYTLRGSNKRKKNKIIVILGQVPAYASLALIVFCCIWVLHNSINAVMVTPFSMFSVFANDPRLHPPKNNFIIKPSVAMLIEENISTKPDKWTGNELGLVNGAKLQFYNMRSAILVDSFLVKADIFGSDFEGAIFTKADLRRASFENCNLRWSVFDRADLRESKIINADMRDSYLSYADMSKSSLYSIYAKTTNLERALIVRAKLISCNLRQVNLSYANLRHSDMRNAKFVYARLRHCNLRNTDLRCANFEGADLSDSDLRYSNLNDANLQQSDLRGADLRYTKGLTRAQLNKVRINDKTKLPQHLKK